jgi:hypothetical protein
MVIFSFAAEAMGGWVGWGAWFACSESCGRCFFVLSTAVDQPVDPGIDAQAGAG